MGIAFVKLIKWIISVGFLIIGAAFLQKFSDTGSIRPVGIVIMSFGIVFWMSKSTYEAPKKVFLISLGIIIAGAILTHLFTGAFIGAFTGFHYYTSWFLTTAALGVPAMFYTFIKTE
jgi:hypothetical protein